MNKGILIAVIVVIAAGVAGGYFALGPQLATSFGYQPNLVLQNNPFPYEVSLSAPERAFVDSPVTITPVFTPALPASFKYQGFAATWVFSRHGEYPDRHVYDKDIANPQTITYNDCRGAESDWFSCPFIIRYKLFLPGQATPFLERETEVYIDYY